MWCERLLKVMTPSWTHWSLSLRESFDIAHTTIQVEYGPYLPDNKMESLLIAGKSDQYKSCCRGKKIHFCSNFLFSEDKAANVIAFDHYKAGVAAINRDKTTKAWWRLAATKVTMI